jgi:hypothetical protein
MFELEIQNPSLLGFFVQQTGVCIGLVMWGLITVEVPRSFSTLNRPVAAVLETLCIIVLAATPSFFLVAQCKVMPRLSHFPANGFGFCQQSLRS